MLFDVTFSDGTIRTLQAHDRQQLEAALANVSIRKVEPKQAQDTYIGTLNRILHTRAIDDHDLIVVGNHSYVVPAGLYSMLDTLHCGDTVKVTYEVNGRVIALGKKEG